MLRIAPNRYILAGTVLLLAAGSASAQSINKSQDPKQQSQGTTGALGNVNADGIATDPQGVAAQQGGATKSSAGTVGAAPGADTPSQKPTH